MMRDQRGFEYQLEPLRRRCEWDLNEVTLALAALNSDLAGQEGRADALARQMAQVSAELAQRAHSGVLNLELHRLGHSYLNHLHERLHQKRQRVQQLQHQRDELIQRSQRLRKFSDGVEQHRDEALRDHASGMARVAFKDADDIWLQRTSWRKAQ